MKTDIQIAQEAEILKINEIAAKIGLSEDDYDQYGKYKAKVDSNLLKKLEDRKDGKLILVTAMTPTPAGEGKSTVTIGLSQALNKLHKNSVAVLREPSLGPVFGIKGGAAGGARRGGNLCGPRVQRRRVPRGDEPDGWRAAVREQHGLVPVELSCCPGVDGAGLAHVASRGMDDSAGEWRRQSDG